MSQTIAYMKKAQGVTPAADHAAATLQPLQGSYPANTQQVAGVPTYLKSDLTLNANIPLATNDIIVGACLPANCELLDAILIAGDIDSGTALTMTVAQLYQDFTDIVSGTDVITASTVGQTGGVARASVAIGTMIEPQSDYDIWYGIKIAAGATGVNTTTGPSSGYPQLRLILIYQPAENR